MATNGISLVLDNKELGGVIPLHSASRGLLSYNPSRASRGAETVTETIRLWFDSGLQAATQGTGILRKIGTYFVDARRRAQLGQGDQIWLILDKGIGDGDWRSEVLDGEIVYPEETLGPAFLQSDKGEVAIIITRRAYWEKDTEYEIPLSIGALAAIGGKAIENHHDGDAGDVNWVSWDVPAIIGDLPTPLKVEFKNTDATHDYRRILMALTYDTDDVGDMSTNWSLEGEDNGYNPGTVTANANSSDGNYMVEAWTAVTETLVATWTLDPTELARGNPFRAAYVERLREPLRAHDDCSAYRDRRRGSVARQAGQMPLCYCLGCRGRVSGPRHGAYPAAYAGRVRGVERARVPLLPAERRRNAYRQHRPPHVHADGWGFPQGRIFILPKRHAAERYAGG
jgi:hypothetical protein